MKRIVIAVVLIGFLFSCRKETPPALPAGKGVFIVNEGNFNFGNGEISFYNPETKQVSNNLFSTANGYSLGDVIQSMFIKDSLGFIVVNNSQKIEVVKIPSFEKLLTISIPNSSPRYFIPTNDSIGYVSDIYANKIHVVNFRTGIVVTQIPVPQYCEHMVKVDEYVFAEGKRIFADSSSKGALMRINSNSHTYIDRKLFVGDAGGVVVDKDNHVWIAIDEKSSLSVPAGLKCFDKNFALLHDFEFQGNGNHPGNLAIDGIGEVLYFTNGDVYSHTVNSATLSSNLFVAEGNRNFYSLAVDPETDEVYLSDALDYVQPSSVFRYNKNGELIHSFTAGVISGNFAFSYE